MKKIIFETDSIPKLTEWNTKLFLIFCIIFGLSFYSKAQYYRGNNHKGDLTAFYFGGGLGIGREATPAGLSCTFFLSNNLGGSVSYKYKSFIANDLPSDYQNGFTVYGDGKPSDKLNILSFCFIKEFPTENTRVRYGLEGGPAWVKYEQANFDPQQSGFFGSNYGVNYIKHETIGISLRAKLEFPLATFLGLELAAFTNINKYRPFVGVEAYLTLGQVRE